MLLHIILIKMCYSYSSSKKLEVENMLIFIFLI